MRIGRTLPPASAPLNMKDIFWGILGIFQETKFLKRFEQELCNYFRVSDCFLFSSGKAALAHTLLALKERAHERDEVVMPAYICYSVPSAVVRAGLKVVPCDMEPNTLEMDLEKLAPLLRETTLCVIVPHLFGIPAQMSKVASLCRKKEIIIIEDAAQTMGITHKGALIGTQGDVAFFSLGRGKNLSTVEGGILLSKDPLLSKQLRYRWTQLDSYNSMGKAILLVKAMLIFLFSRPNLYWFPKLFPFLRLGATIFDPKFSIKKMSGAQAGLARNWEIKLRLLNNQRKQHTQRFVKELSNNASVFLFQQNGLVPACLRLPLFIKKPEDKEHILSESEKKGLGIMFTYPDSIDGISGLKNMLTPGQYPVAKSVAQNILTLPVHPTVSYRDVQKIVGLFT